jgi:hypothetical protein
MRSRFERAPNPQVINTTAVIRHALHDTEHHLLDIRRNIAHQQLRRWRTGRRLVEACRFDWECSRSAGWGEELQSDVVRVAE